MTVDCHAGLTHADVCISIVKAEAVHISAGMKDACSEQGLLHRVTLTSVVPAESIIAC